MRACGGNSSIRHVWRWARHICSQSGVEIRSRIHGWLTSLLAARPEEGVPTRSGPIAKLGHDSARQGLVDHSAWRRTPNSCKTGFLPSNWRRLSGGACLEQCYGSFLVPLLRGRKVALRWEKRSRASAIGSKVEPSQFLGDLISVAPLHGGSVASVWCPLAPRVSSPGRLDGSRGNVGRATHMVAEGAQSHQAQQAGDRRRLSN